MEVESAQRWCKRCKAHVFVEPPRMDYRSIKMGSWRCSRCGSIEVDDARATAVGLVVLVLVIVTVLMMGFVLRPSTGELQRDVAPSKIESPRK